MDIWYRLTGDKWITMLHVKNGIVCQVVGPWEDFVDKTLEDIEALVQTRGFKLEKIEEVK